MFKSLILVATVVLSVVPTLVSEASAQTVNTGGSNMRHLPPEGRVLYNRGRSGEFGRNNPWVPGSEYARGGYSNRGAFRYGGGMSYGMHGGGYHRGGMVAVGEPVLVRRTFVRRYFVSGGQASVQTVAPAPAQVVVREAAPIVVQKQVVRTVSNARRVYRGGHRAVAKACDTCNKKGGSVTVGNITATASAPNATATNVVSINNVTLTGGTTAGTAGAGASVTKTTVVGWTNNGKNAQCDGKPKFVKFTCVSPTTGKETQCMCD